MVIKSSETKSKQPFLELYKRLSKEVVKGGEKLLKEIQNELFEYKNCGLSDDDNYSKVRLYYDFDEKRITTIPILGSSVRISDILSITTIINYSLEEFHNKFGEYVIKTINKKKLKSLTVFELYTNFYIDREAVLKQSGECLISRDILSTKSFQSRYFDWITIKNQKQTVELMPVLFSDKVEAEEFLRFIAKKYSKRNNCDLLMYLVLKLNQGIISEEVFQELLNVLLSKKRDTFKFKNQWNFLDSYFANNRLLIKMIESKMENNTPTEKEVQLFSTEVTAISANPYLNTSIKRLSTHQGYLIRYLLKFLNKKDIAFVVRGECDSESLVDPLKDDSVILIDDSISKGWFRWSFLLKVDSNFDIFKFFGDDVSWLKILEYNPNFIDKYDNDFSVKSLSIRSLLKSPNFYLLPIQKHYLIGNINFLKSCKNFSKEELELLDLFENVKVAEWDEKRKMFKTHAGFFDGYDIDKKSFILKK